MKTCPDCAESVQDAARKCRYCGYRFDPLVTPGSTATATDPVPVPATAPDSVPASAPPPAAAPNAPDGSALPLPGPGPFLLLSAGGALIALGAVAFCLAIPAEGRDATLAVLTVFPFSASGILLAAGWGLLVRRGHARPAAVVGSLLLTAGWAGGLGLWALDPDLTPFAALTEVLGLGLCVWMHLETVEALGFAGTYLAALVSLIGLGGALVLGTMHIDLPRFVEVGLTYLGFGGAALFGVALAVAGVLRARAS